ncbi:MAG TPA: hypothetical protein VD907_04250 [Verrucomicrobiae bacterium]|nr:hypothetical protein [Verrucomicrobiae bacterium]
MATPEQLSRLHAQVSELVTGVHSGSLDPDRTLVALQAILETRNPENITAVISDTTNTPSWYISPKRQLEKAAQLWPAAALPAPPEQFVPLTTSEVLLLHVPDTFENLWCNITPPPGYTKRNGGAGRKRKLNPAPNIRRHEEPVWLAFDPEHGKGKPPQELWGNPRLASTEVLSALIQFPDWCLAWGNSASPPSLSGCRCRRLSVPFLGRNDMYGELVIEYDYVQIGREKLNNHASPSVRKCD